jgi:excisionase family DNA binding protein
VSDRLLTADEAAEILNVPTSWVRDASRRGELPCIRLGRYVRFDRDDLLAWIERQKQGGGSRKHRPTVSA